MKVLEWRFGVRLVPVSAWRALLLAASCGLIYSTAGAGPASAFRSNVVVGSYDGSRGFATCSIPADDPTHATPPSNGRRSIGDDPDPYTGSRVTPGHPRIVAGNGPPTNAQADASSLTDPRQIREVLELWAALALAELR